MTDPGGDPGTAERGRTLFRRGVMAIHVLQLPLFLGLMIALVVFGVSFFFAIYEAIVSGEFLDRDAAILLVLDLLDMVFIANLIVMVMISGYNAYGAATRLPVDGDDEINFSDEFAPVKSRIAGTLVIISGIHLVHEVLAGDIDSTQDLLVLAVVHLVLLVTAALFVLTSGREGQTTLRRGRPAGKDGAP